MSHSENRRASGLDELCEQRRRHLAESRGLPVQEERWGLALSGGGIRSATFCFGLIKALARNDVFHRFDLMSTVSGGGYIGAMVGRLYQNQAESLAGGGGSGDQAPEKTGIEQALADSDKRWFGWWLRANGRYLVPRPGPDTMFAVATFCRNLLGVHIELAMLVLVLGSFVVAFDLMAWYLLDMVYLNYGLRWIDDSGLDVLASWPTPWLLLPVPITLAGMCACAYWLLPAGDRMRAGANAWATLIVTLAGLLLITWFWDVLREISQAKTPALLSFGLLLLLWLGGALIVLGITWKTDKTQECQRHRLTFWLAGSLLAAIVIVVAGIVDILAWQISGITGNLQGALGALAFVIAVILRISLPNVAGMTGGLPPLSRRTLVLMLNITGMILFAAVVIFWMAILHRVATRAIFNTTLLNFQLGWGRLALLFLPVLVLALLNGRNTEFLNRSSLYPFYRSRLLRSYLGAANGSRFGENIDPAAEYRRDIEFKGSFASVGEVHDKDDVSMASYIPHRAGCPVHLVNMCVNQTRDPKGGLFNQDRKGFMLTVGPEALARVGLNDWEALKPECALSLGAWTAISGAALSPGLGYGTRSGIAALAMMGGIRLGYWWENGLPSQDGSHKKSLFRKYLGKYRQLVNELLAQFDGHRSPVWYLTDGGHFENTGAYALLREECRLIVVADCGADPRYAFNDIENLVRKARIDLQADITFLKPLERKERKDRKERKPRKQLSAFGSLNDLASNESTACLALARIDYRRSKTHGYMVIVKPNMSSGLPVDLVNFRADNPLFPQEPTADQFFSEAQWESYYQLGTILGAHLRAGLLKRIERIAKLGFVVDDGVTLSESESETKPSPKRIPSRILTSGAVTATVSVGAVTTLAASAAQAIYSEQKERHSEQVERSAPMDPAVFQEVVGQYMQWIKQQPVEDERTPDVKLIGGLVRVAVTTCPTWKREAYQHSDAFQQILAAASKACKNRDDDACRMFDKSDGPTCLKATQAPDCDARYWIRDYSRSNPDKVNCGPTLLKVTRTMPGRTETQPEMQPEMPPAPPVLEQTPVPARPAPPPPAPPNVQGEEEKAVANKKECAGYTIYIQIYGPERRDDARKMREEWRALGASVPPIEDVWATARSKNLPRATPYTVPTILYRDNQSITCANALLPAIGTSNVSVLLLKRGRYAPKVIEVWLPREGES